MKKFVTLLSILLTTTAFAQHHFQITEDSKVIWQKVYETSLEFSQVQEIIFNSGKFNDIAVLNDNITCWFNEAPIDYKQAGYSTSQISMMLRDCNVKFFTTVQFKEGKYRVTLEQIQFIQRFDTSFFKKGEISYLENSAIRKGTFNKMVEGNTLNVLDDVFRPMFEFKPPTHLNNEW